MLNASLLFEGGAVPIGKKINVRDYSTSPSTRASCISDSPEITSTTIATRTLTSRELQWGPMIPVLLTTMSSRISVSGSTKAPEQPEPAALQVRWPP